MYAHLNRYPAQRLLQLNTYIVAPKVFTPKESASIIEFGTSKELIEATTGQNKKDKEARASSVRFIGANADTNWIFRKLDHAIEWANEHYYGFDLNGYESFQFTEYTSDVHGHYNWHVDMHLNSKDLNTSGLRKLSASVILNTDYEGGEFQVSNGNQNKPVTVSAAVGDVIVFPGFVPHRVSPVTAGTRYSVVVWVLGPKFV